MNLLKKFILFSLIILMANVTLAQEEQVVIQDTPKFNPGEMIMGHVGDEYEWHICTIGDTHITVPLLCILYSENSGLHIFSSGNLHHGHAEYEGFKISTSGEYEGKIVEIVDGKEVRPWDFSITKNVFALLFSVFLISFIFIKMRKYYEKNVGKAPHGFFNALELVVLFVRDDIAYASLGKKHGDKFMPFLMTVFFFIFINNLLGLVPIFPGGANLTGNIAVTCVLAVMVFIITTINGTKEYWLDIFWPKGTPIWLKIPPILPAVEIMGMFTKPIVLMVRLFANITAGHIIALGFYSLIFLFASNSGIGTAYGVSVPTIIFTVFMSLLELLVAFIQAYVFTLLSSIYFSMAVAEEHEEAEVKKIA